MFGIARAFDTGVVETGRARFQLAFSGDIDEGGTGNRDQAMGHLPGDLPECGR